MICIETLNFSLNRTLLLTVGLWPYQRSKLVQLHAILIFIILTSFIVFQFTAFITAKCTPDFVIKVLSSSLFFISFVIEYNAFWVNIRTVRYLLEQLQHIHNELKDENEIAIIQKYACIAKRYTTKLTLFIGSSVFTAFLLPIWSTILDTFLFANETRPHQTLQIVTEYFIDQEKYFYLIVLHMNAALFIGAFVTLATGTMFLTYLKHACGMFRIASGTIIYSYRIEQAVTISTLENISLEKKIIAYKKITYAVGIHRKAMELCEYLVSKFEGLFFTLTAFGVTCLSLNLFRIVSFGNDTEELLLHFIYVSGLFIYMFLINYCGQEITDHNNNVFLTAYNARWYIAPLHTQKLILFLLQRGSKTFTLHVGNTIVASLETFATLTSASISYFTVLYSTQQ